MGIGDRGVSDGGNEGEVSGMKVFSAIFSICFLILGGMVWIVGLMIIIVGAVGCLRIATKWAIELDIVEWIRGMKNEDSKDA